jgi:hypothetical protein
MKHVRPMTVAKADAYSDFFNAVWRAWQDFRFAKKNEFGF